MIFGITGGTGCGKTTLLNLIREQGGIVFDCDAIYHDMLRSDTAMLQRIQMCFPEAFPDGILDRKKLGSIVFADPEKLACLNTMTQAAVAARVREEMTDQRPCLAAIDAIGLIEAGLDADCDVTVAVTAPEEQRIVRLMQRDQISEAYARHRIAAQHDEKWFREHCDSVLVNDGTKEAFHEKCLAFLRSYGIITAQ